MTKFYEYKRTATTLLWTVRGEKASFNVAQFGADEAIRLDATIDQLIANPKVAEIATVKDGHIEVLHINVERRR